MVLDWRTLKLQKDLPIIWIRDDQKQTNLVTIIYSTLLDYSRNLIYYLCTIWSFEKAYRGSVKKKSFYIV